MKKTIRINISGLIFNIDEDAFDKLQQYLNSINRQFVDTEEGKEIISDVETRIAELFQERNGDRKEVINLPDIDYVIEILGKPEDFEEPAEVESEHEPVIYQRKGTRRMYRDPDNKILSGLSSGLANYFGIDPIIVRVIFILMALFYGTSILVYIILWIVTPEAKTRSQKLEMKGQDINLSNIETSIKNEFNQVKSNLKSFKNSKNFQNYRSNAGDVLNTFWKASGAVIKIALILFGVLFLIIGMGLLGAMTGLYFFDNTFLSPLSWNNVSFSIKEFISLFTDNFNARVMMITSYLIILIPVISIIYFGIRFIFKFKTKNKYIGVYAGALWTVSLLLLIISSIKIAYGLRVHEEMNQTYKIDLKNSDTIYVELHRNDPLDDWNYNKARFNKVYLEFDNDKPKLYGQPNFYIEKSLGQETEMVVSRHSNGINSQEAIKFAKSIEYDWQQSDSIIFLRRYFGITGENKLRNQKLYATLKIPVGKVVYFGKNMDLLCSYIENTYGYSCDEMTGQYWIMTEQGLKSMNEKHFDNENLEDNQDSLKIISQDKTIQIQKEIEDMKAELDSM